MPLPLDIQNLKIRRGAFTLDIPRLTVDSGVIVGLVGRNGAGKTTLFDAIGGFIAPDAGSLSTFDLDPIRDVVAQRRKVALMTDDMPIFDMTIGGLMRAVAPFYPTWDADLVGTLVDRFQLRAGQKVSALSKGEGTRVRLVLSLAWRPALLLLDEPGTGLDVPSRRAMLAEVLSIVRDPSRTVFFSSHNAEDVERIADRVVLLDKGKIVADGATSDVVGEGRTLEEVLAGSGV